MMDYVVDHSAVTAPALPSGWLKSYHSGNKESSSRVHATSANDENYAEPSWVGLYQTDAITVTISAPRRLASSFKVTSLTSEHASQKELLKRSLDYIYCNDEASLKEPDKSRVALRGVIDVVEDLADSGDFSELDELLKLVNPLRLRPVTAVAFLRSSFASRERLRNWNGLYQVVYAHLANSGENPARALRGLSAPGLV